MSSVGNFLVELKEAFNRNRSIFYSAILVFAIPAILFFSTYYSLGQFEKNFNHLIQTKGALLENVFIASLKTENNEISEIQRKIDRIVIENPDVQELKILEVDEGGEGNTIIASSSVDEIGKSSNDIKDFLAVGISEGVAGIVVEDGVRFWEVAKKVRINGNRDVVIKTKISLRDVDKSFQRSINRTYWAIILAALVLILLVTNYVRLNQYVLMYNKIKEVDEMKDNFVSMASHELKTPLTAINGYLDLLKSSNKKLNKEEQHYLDNIQHASNHLKTLVGDILEVSRIEQGRISYEFSNTSSVKIAKEIVDSLFARAQEKKLELAVTSEIDEDEGSIYVDPDRLKQVLINLIGNAIKYTETGRVDVFIRKDKDEIRIAVEDTGIGMSSEERENLFGKFNRIQNDKTKGVEGTGLGLWITKQLVEQMKGRVLVESIKGKGTKFVVVFKAV